MKSGTGLACWIELAKRRGGAPFLLTLLDAVEPLAPVLAQALLVAQPLANLWPGGEDLRELADLLEAPDGLRELRSRLADEQAE